MVVRIAARAFAVAVLASVTAAQTADPTRLPPDANGNPRRLAPRTRHVSNYDEAKVGTYTLPDPLRLMDGGPVSDRSIWLTQRRPELMKVYEDAVFGRVPARAPHITWSEESAGTRAGRVPARVKQLVGRAGAGTRSVTLRVSLYTPLTAQRAVPVILLLNFGGGNAPVNPNLPSSEPPVAAEILARGWGYATVGYQDIQPDRAGALNEGVIGLALSDGVSTPAPGEWGAISAWAWGVSRIIDHFETDPAVDNERIAIQGFSRNGKAALWASARDERIKAVFAACAGEMGSALSMRDYGETIDDMAHNFPWWFSSTFQQWPGRWKEMPVDAHMLIALSAPRGVFLTGGTGDQWADPVGMFSAAVAAGPVYRLLGARDLGTSALPPLDFALTAGDIGWRYHTGGHTVPADDWNAYLLFLDKYFGPR